MTPDVPPTFSGSGGLEVKGAHPFLLLLLQLLECRCHLVTSYDTEQACSRALTRQLHSLLDCRQQGFGAWDLAVSGHTPRDRCPKQQAMKTLTSC